MENEKQFRLIVWMVGVSQMVRVYSPGGSGVHSKSWLLAVIQVPV